MQSYLVDLFSANSNDQKNAVQVRNLTAKQLLDRGVDKLESSTDLSADVNAALYRLFGELYETVMETDRSVGLHERSVKAAEVAHGNQSMPYAMALLELAWVMREQNPGKPPIAMVEQAKTILARLAPGGEEYAQALYFESSFTVLGDPQRAARAAIESVRLMEANGGSNRRLAFAQRTVGQAERALANFATAAVWFERAANAFAALYGPDGVEVGMTRSTLAECHRQQLHLAEAEAEAVSSLEILRPFRGKRVDSEIHGQRVLRLMADRGRISQAEKKMQSVYDDLEATENRPKDSYVTTGITLSDFAATRGDAMRAAHLIARHREPIPGGSHITHLLVLLRAARTALVLANMTEARRAVAEMRVLERERGMPVDFSLAIAATAAEVAAADGDGARALAEYATFHSKFPMSRVSPATQLLIDMSKARTFAALKRWPEVDSTLRDWSSKPLLPGQELPVAVKGEMLLLAGEAAQKMGKSEARQLLIEANEILTRIHVPTSAALARSKVLLAQLSSAT